MSAVEQVDEVTVVDFDLGRAKDAYRGPYKYLQFLLWDLGYRLLPATNFIDNMAVRRSVMEDMQMKLCFPESSTLSHAKTVGLLVVGHTTEATLESVDFLRQSIPSMMSKTTHQPTFSHVTPQVAGWLEEPEATEYLGRMLAPPSRPLSGWLPSPSEKPIVDAWQQRFSDPDLQMRFEIYQNYLNGLETTHDR